MPPPSAPPSPSAAAPSASAATALEGAAVAFAVRRERYSARRHPEMWAPTAHGRIDPEVALPPAWAFGVLHGCYGDQAAALSHARRLREGGFPADALWVDSSFWDVSTRGPRGYLNFRGDPAGFPDVPGLARELHGLGLRFGIWVWDRLLDAEKELFEEFERAGFFKGEPIVGNTWHNAGATAIGRFVDFDNSRAAARWKELFAPLLRSGIDFFKLDSGPAAGFVRTHFEMTQAAAGPEARGFVLSHLGRETPACIKRHPGVWTGDCLPAWRHPAYPDPENWVWGGLSEHVRMLADPEWFHAEYPFMANDTGGFRNMPDVGQASPELFARWAQFSALGPLMTVFGSMHFPSQNAPFTWPEDTADNFRRHARLRLRLFPYLYSAALGVRLRSRRMTSPGGAPDQFLVGEDLLVAPVLEPGAVSRTVRFPADADWHDFWSGAVHRGGRSALVPAPLDRLPLFVRSGALLPLRAEADSIAAGDNTSLELRVFPPLPGRTGRFLLREDDGLTEAYRLGGYSETELLVERTAPGRLRLRIGAGRGDASCRPATRAWTVRVAGLDASELRFVQETATELQLELPAPPPHPRSAQA